MGIFDKFKSGFKKSASAFTSGLRDIVVKKEIDHKTLVMISAVKSLSANFKFDIEKKKLEVYPKNGKFDFIISSIAKNCGHNNFKENYKCSFYKPLISSTLIN